MCYIFQFCSRVFIPVTFYFVMTFIGLNPVKSITAVAMCARLASMEVGYKYKLLQVGFTPTSHHCICLFNI